MGAKDLATALVVFFQARCAKQAVCSLMNQSGVCLLELRELRITGIG